MNKYILMLGVAGVALGSYCAYAGNSATMTVTATIAHDVSLTKTGDINMGTITINPAYAGTDTEWYYNAGVPSYDTGYAVVSADNATIGTFTANIPNPEDCNMSNWSCGGLQLEEGGVVKIFGSDNSNYCWFAIYNKYGSGNSFEVMPDGCIIEDASTVTPGSRSYTFTISYSPE